MSTPRRSLVAAALLAVVACDAAAQSPPAALRRRMDAFATALRTEAPLITIAEFFPRDSAWEVVRVPNRPTLNPAVQVTRIAPDSTLAALSHDERSCESFVVQPEGGEVGPAENTLTMEAQWSRRPWRYAGRLRFVAPGKPASDPTYVEWRRERGRWVVSRIGERYYYEPRLAGVDAAYLATSDTTAGNGLPLERRLAGTTDWFRESHAIVVRGRRYTKYGAPRTVESGELSRFGNLGVVPIFVERGAEATPMILYALTAPGEYQPYMTYGGIRGCRTK